MRKRELDAFRTLLEARRHELINEASRTVDGMGENREQFPDPTDRASLEGNRNLLLRIRDRERKLISKIDEALGRIEDGSYGKCEECGADIGIERLRARPVTTLCIDCKSLQEAQERLGLGHAVLVARRYVGDEPFAVLLGDVIIDAAVPCTRQLLQVYATHGPVIALLAVPPEKTHLYGVIAGKPIAKGLYHVDTLVEKPAPGTAPTNLSVLGRYVLPPEIFDILERTAPGRGGEIQLTDGLQTLARRLSLYGLETEGRLYDAGDRVGFVEATVAFALKRPKLAAELRPALRRLLDG